MLPRPLNVLLRRAGELNFHRLFQASSDTQLLRDRLETVSTRRGLLLARLRLPARRHCLVEDMVRDWLLVYRRMAATASTPSPAFATATDASGGNGVEALSGGHFFD